MPYVNVRLIEGAFTPEQKRDMIHRLTETMVEIEGENLRPVTWVVIDEDDRYSPTTVVDQRTVVSHQPGRRSRQRSSLRPVACDGGREELSHQRVIPASHLRSRRGELAIQGRGSQSLRPAVEDDLGNRCTPVRRPGAASARRVWRAKSRSFSIATACRIEPPLPGTVVVRPALPVALGSELPPDVQRNQERIPAQRMTSSSGVPPKPGDPADLDDSVNLCVSLTRREAVYAQPLAGIYSS